MNLETATQVQKSSAPDALSAGGNLQRKCDCGQHMSSGSCSSCGKSSSNLSSPPMLQARLRIRNFNSETKSSNPNDLPEVINEAISSPSQPLNTSIRSHMESNFGQEFGHVRVHTGTRAAKSARAVNALAYTVGRDIVFGAGQYSTQFTQGRKLLAHELAHVVQQGGVSMSSARVVTANPRFEQEADAVAKSVSEGRRLPVLQRSANPLFARQQAQRTLPQQDGSEIVVSRFITPGECRLRPETRTSVSGDITRSGAFLEVRSCRGNVSGGGRGELNYDQALNDAGQAVGNLLSNLAGGRSSNDAFNTFRNDISNVSPQAQLRFNLNLPGFRASISGTGTGSPGSGVSGTGRARFEVDVGPVVLGVEPSVSGGTNQETEGRVLVTVGNRRSQADPNCFICSCTEPQLTHQCARRPPPQAPTPTPRLEPVIIPLFFEFEKTTPRQGWARRYNDMLRLAVTRISQGYRIARIIGNASPEGREQPRSARARFQGNIDLANRRAIEAQRDLNTELRTTLSGLQMRGLEHLRQALSGGYPVEGRGELFGSNNNAEVPDRNLPSFLQSELQSPSNDEPDQLQQQNVIGEGLPAAVRTETEREVSEFRAGRQGSTTLFPLFRRALIFLEPPAPVINLQLSPETLRRVIGEPIPCTAAHIRALANAPPPRTGLFRGSECNRPGQRP